MLLRDSLPNISQCFLLLQILFPYWCLCSTKFPFLEYGEKNDLTAEKTDTRYNLKILGIRHRWEKKNATVPSSCLEGSDYCRERGSRKVCQHPCAEDNGSVERSWQLDPTRRDTHKKHPAVMQTSLYFVSLHVGEATGWWGRHPEPSIVMQLPTAPVQILSPLVCLLFSTELWINSRGL